MAKRVRQRAVFVRQRLCLRYILRFKERADTAPALSLTLLLQCLLFR